MEIKNLGVTILMFGLLSLAAALLSPALGIESSIIVFIALTSFTAIAISLFLWQGLGSDQSPPTLEDEWWGKGPLPKDGNIAVICSITDALQMSSLEERRHCQRLFFLFKLFDSQIDDTMQLINISFNDPVFSLRSFQVLHVDNTRISVFPMSPLVRMVKTFNKLAENLDINFMPYCDFPTQFPEDDTTIKDYTIKVDDDVLEDLKSRLNNTRFVEPLDNVQFQYGFHPSYLKEVVNYWKTQYDWKKHEKELNEFNHFVTQIEGIDIHFIHQKPDVKDKKLRVLPLLIVHGWPGSVYEFYKILPLLTTPREDQDYVFEVICPSIPGYGFSEAPHHPGFSIASAARVFTKLMTRLGHREFYAQGGDWGSPITSIIATAYPDRVLGLHLNMTITRFGATFWIKYAIGSYFPSLFMTAKEYSRMYPFKKVFFFYLEEKGYHLIQSTKPDTVGSGLADSPAGLAAYIMEKFSTWTDRSYRDLPDGGLTKKFTLDELITNVMIYWCTNTIASSQRFYKEAFNKKSLSYGFESFPIKVATGISKFPNEILLVAKSFLQQRFPNIVLYTEMPRGGHFAAFEEPQLLADEIWKFVIYAEKSRKPEE